MRNYYRDNSNIIRGYIEGGRCFDNSGCFVCYLLENGEFVTSLEYGSILYRLHEDGMITKGTTREICGYVWENGSVTKTCTNLMNESIGRFDFYPGRTVENIDTMYSGHNPSDTAAYINYSTNKSYTYFAPEWMNSFNLFVLVGLIIWGFFNLPMGWFAIGYSIVTIYISSVLHGKGYKDIFIQIVMFIIHVIICYFMIMSWI